MAVATAVGTVGGAMAEHDWLSDLSEAISDDAPRRPPPTSGDGDELVLSGPGRPLEGWADQLASAVGEQSAEPANAPPPPSPEAPSGSSGTTAIEARVEAALSRLADHLGELTARLAALEKTIADAIDEVPEDEVEPGATVDALLAEVALQRADHQQTMSAVTELGQVLVKLQAKLDELATRPVSDTDSLAVTLRDIQESLHELVQRPVPETPEPVEIEPVIVAVVALHRELSTIASAITELAARSARPTPTLTPPPDLAAVEAALAEQRGELAGIAAAVTSVEELRQLVTQLHTAVIDTAARPADPPEVEVIVTPESLAPVARVLGKRIKEVRKADRSSIELLASTFSDRLSAMESRLDEAAANDDLIRQAIGELAKNIETLQHRRRG